VASDMPGSFDLSWTELESQKVYGCSATGAMNLGNQNP
jgi:hypothetical protein